MQTGKTLPIVLSTKLAFPEHIPLSGDRGGCSTPPTSPNVQDFLPVCGGMNECNGSKSGSFRGILGQTGLVPSHLLKTYGVEASIVEDDINRPSSSSRPSPSESFAVLGQNQITGAVPCPASARLRRRYRSSFCPSRLASSIRPGPVCCARQ